MVSFRGKKRTWATPTSVPLADLIQNFRRASPPLSYAESPPPGMLHAIPNSARAGYEASVSYP